MATAENGLPYIPRKAAVVDARGPAKTAACGSAEGNPIDGSATCVPPRVAEEFLAEANLMRQGQQPVHCSQPNWDEAWHQCGLVLDVRTGSVTQGPVVSTAAEIVQSMHRR